MPRVQVGLTPRIPVAYHDTSTMTLQVFTHADPRLLTPPDLIQEHRLVHQLLVLTIPGPERDFLLFRHELLRIAANARSGMRHSVETTANQREHPSQVPLMDLAILDDDYARALLIYERWVYIKRRRDVQTINILFHALMKKLPVKRPQVFGDNTPWAGSTPGKYLADYRREAALNAEIFTPVPARH